jgi:hypothetical protein
MAGLLGAMVAGAVGGAAKQNLKDLEEKEVFDYQQALNDAQMQREIFMKKIGYAHDKEMQTIRKQDERDLSDYQFENNVKAKQKEIELTEAAKKRERDSIAGVGGDDLQTRGENLIKKGYTQEGVQTLGAVPKKKQLMKLGDKAYDPDTGELMIDGSDGSGGSGSGGKKGKSEKDWNDETREVQKQITESIGARFGFNKDTGFADPNDKQKAEKAISYGGLIYKNNSAVPIERIAEVSSYAATIPESKQYIQKELPDGSIVKIRGVTYDGEDYFFNDKIIKVDTPAPIGKPAPKAEAKPKVKPAPKFDENKDLDNKAALAGEKQRRIDSVPASKQSEIAKAYNGMSIDDLKDEIYNIQSERAGWSDSDYRIDYINKLIEAKTAAMNYKR